VDQSTTQNVTLTGFVSCKGIRKHVCVRCHCEPDEVSIAIRDEGQGFDIDKVPDPTAPENIQSSHGRGIYLMKALMDEVRFEQGGALVYMLKRSSSNREALPSELE
jgi:serine/threonine-protein kinase RsbW